MGKGAEVDPPGSEGVGRPLCGIWMMELWGSTHPPAPDSPFRSLAAHPRLPSSDPDLIPGEVARLLLVGWFLLALKVFFPCQSPSPPVGRAGVCCAPAHQACLELISPVLPFNPPAVDDLSGCPTHFPGSCSTSHPLWGGLESLP